MKTLLVRCAYRIKLCLFSVYQDLDFDYADYVKSKTLGTLIIALYSKTLLIISIPRE
jgi:hypothetical protein